MLKFGREPLKDIEDVGEWLEKKQEEDFDRQIECAVGLDNHRRVCFRDVINAGGDFWLAFKYDRVFGGEEDDNYKTDLLKQKDKQQRIKKGA